MRSRKTMPMFCFAALGTEGDTHTGGACSLGMDGVEARGFRSQAYLLVLFFSSRCPLPALPGPRLPSYTSVIQNLSGGLWICPLSFLVGWTGWAPSSQAGVPWTCFDFVRSKTLFVVTGVLNHLSPSIFVIGIYRKVHIRSEYIACCIFAELTSLCH